MVCIQIDITLNMVFTVHLRIWSGKEEVMYFQKYTSGGQWRWRLKAANHEIIASGESYVRERDCDHAIDLVKGTDSQTPVE